MFIVFKIVIAVLLLFAHFKMSFANTKIVKWKHLLILILCLFLFAITFSLLAKYLLLIYTGDESIIKSISKTYIFMTFALIFIFIFRASVQKISGRITTRISDSSSNKFQKDFFKETPKRIFGFQQLIFFLGGVVIILGISIKEIPNTLTPVPAKLNLNHVLKLDNITDQMIAINKHISSKIKKNQSVDSLSQTEKTFLIVDNTNIEILINGFEESFKEGFNYNYNYNEFITGLKNIQANRTLIAISKIDSIINLNSKLSEVESLDIDSIYQNSTLDMDSLLLKYIIKNKDDLK